MDSTDSAVNLSLDDLTGFTQPLGGSGGMGQADNSFDASMDGSTSFLSGADMSTDTFDLVGDSNSDSGYTRTPSTSGSVWLDSRDSVSSGRGTGLGVSLSDIQSEGSGVSLASLVTTGPFTPRPRSESGTPSLPDEGEFPCAQCDKKFGNRRNLMSHMRRHTGGWCTHLYAANIDLILLIKATTNCSARAVAKDFSPSQSWTPTNENTQVCLC